MSSQINNLKCSLKKYIQVIEDFWTGKFRSTWDSDTKKWKQEQDS